MKKHIIPLICVLFLLISGCSAPAAPEAASALPAEAAETGPGENWQPILEIERLSPTGAVILFQADNQPENCLILSGNDYALQIRTENGWENLPTTQDHVYWVKDAFVVAAVPRDDIDWEWLYGSLAPGQYRIGKEVALYQQDQVLDRATVYAEFLLPEYTDDPEASDRSPAEIPEEYLVSGDYPYEYPPLTPQTRYSYSDAMQSNVVILENGSAIENQHVWSAFIRAVEEGQTGTVRCTQLGEDYGFPDVYDVTFDGILYTIHWFENGEEKLFAFKQLIRFREDPDTNTAVRYVLVMDRNATWEDIQWGLISQEDIHTVAHMVVYQELRYVPSHPPIPETGTVSLVFRGREILAATESQAAQLRELASAARYITQKPETRYNGLDLTFTGADGSTVTLWLSLDTDHFLYDGSFYSCSQEKLLKIFGLTQWPDVMNAYS